MRRRSFLQGLIAALGLVASPALPKYEGEGRVLEELTEFDYFYGSLVPDDWCELRRSITETSRPRHCIAFSLDYPLPSFEKVWFNGKEYGLSKMTVRPDGRWHYEYVEK